MSIISVVAEKGGPGKTTVLTNLASYWASQGQKVLILDLDPQQSANVWGKARKTVADVSPLDSFYLDGADLRPVIQSFAEQYDMVLLDTPGRDDERQRQALVCADLALMVAAPGGYDYLHAPHTFDVIAQAQTFRRQFTPNAPLHAALVFNRARARSVLVRQMRQSFAEHLNANELSILRAELGCFDDFAYGAMQGTGVLETAPTGRAAQQIRSLGKEIEAMFFGWSVEEECVG